MFKLKCKSGRKRGVVVQCNGLLKQVKLFIISSAVLRGVQLDDVTEAVNSPAGHLLQFVELTTSE